MSSRPGVVARGLAACKCQRISGATRNASTDAMPAQTTLPPTFAIMGTSSRASLFLPRELVSAGSKVAPSQHCKVPPTEAFLLPSPAARQKFGSRTIRRSCYLAKVFHDLPICCTPYPIHGAKTHHKVAIGCISLGALRQTKIGTQVTCQASTLSPRSDLAAHQSEGRKPNISKD